MKDFIKNYIKNPKYLKILDFLGKYGIRQNRQKNTNSFGKKCQAEP